MKEQLQKLEELHYAVVENAKELVHTEYGKYLYGDATEECVKKARERWLSSEEKYSDLHHFLLEMYRMRSETSNIEHP